MSQILNSLVDPAVLVAAIGIIAGVVSHIWRGRAEEQRTNKAVLGEIRRLLIGIEEHRKWFEKLRPEERHRHPLIPFSYVVYKKQVGNIGSLESELVANAVQFYGYVEFLNSLQATRKEQRAEDFDGGYLAALRRCTSEFYEKFDKDFSKRGIPIPPPRSVSPGGTPAS